MELIIPNEQPTWLTYSWGEDEPALKEIAVVELMALVKRLHPDHPLKVSQCDAYDPIYRQWIYRVDVTTDPRYLIYGKKEPDRVAIRQDSR